MIPNILNGRDIIVIPRIPATLTDLKRWLILLWMSFLTAPWLWSIQRGRQSSQTHMKKNKRISVPLFYRCWCWSCSSLCDFVKFFSIGAVFSSFRGFFLAWISSSDWPVKADNPSLLTPFKDELVLKSDSSWIIVTIWPSSDSAEGLGRLFEARFCQPFFYSTFPTNKNNNDNKMDRQDTITLNISLRYKKSS